MVNTNKFPENERFYEKKFSNWTHMWTHGVVFIWAVSGIFVVPEAIALTTFYGQGTFPFVYMSLFFGYSLFGYSIYILLHIFDSKLNAPSQLGVL